jgi:cyanate lyase
MQEGFSHEFRIASAVLVRARTRSVRSAPPIPPLRGKQAGTDGAMAAEQEAAMKRDPEQAVSALMKPMKREDVTDLIVFRKIKMGVRWSDVATKVGQSKEWTTAACLGQMQMTRRQAETVGKVFDLPEEAVLILQTVPYKGSLPTAVPTDPLIYRFYELVNVYGMTFKELIHEEFGDGIMSAIDFNMDLKREPNEKGDRVRIEMSGKFLPYKMY